MCKIVHGAVCQYTDKKENKIFLILQNAAVASSYTVKYLRISSYTVLGSYDLQLLHFEFPYSTCIWGNMIFFFNSVRMQNTAGSVPSNLTPGPGHGGRFAVKKPVFLRGICPD